MTAEPRFNELLNAAARGWCERKGEEGVLSLALPINGVDPLQKLPLLAKEHTFRFLWDVAPGLSLAAAGQCQCLDLAGPRRFELAQRYCDATLSRLTETNPYAPAQARPRILLAFNFFENTAERKRSNKIPPSVQAVLPRWQLSRQGHQGWLRLNGVATHEADARELAEKLWLMAEYLSKQTHQKHSTKRIIFTGISSAKDWQDCYQPALSQGIDLVNNGELHKLVLAVRQSILLQAPLDPLSILTRLRQEQSGSCRFLWQKSPQSAFFGASPERLLSLRGQQLHSDALAGTASKDDDGQKLLQSEKDRREHELVVSSITNQLNKLGIKPRRPRSPQLAKHGQLVHLHTPITAYVPELLPLHVADALHPTPAVAGLPRKTAMTWLRTLEPFERGGYAAPIGWIDSSGNAELRVAIRCGHTKGHLLELTAGAGLVKGSIAERELQEVGLKLAVLADQLDLQPTNSNRRLIT